MKVEKSRVAALAPTAVLFASLFGAGGTGAWAQELALPAQASTETTPIETAPVETAPVEAVDAAFQPQFYSEAVVQPLDQEPAFDPAAPAPYREAATLPELVRAMPTDAELSTDVQCLAQAVYFEARGEPLDGQLAVARVVINRAQSGLYPGDYCSVVKQRAQFSFVRNGRIPQPKVRSSAWRKAKAVAQIAHQDLWESEAGDALFFHATYVKPSWANRKTQLARIDTHVFYR